MKKQKRQKHMKNTTGTYEKNNRGDKNIEVSGTQEKIETTGTYGEKDDRNI